MADRIDARVPVHLALAAMPDGFDADMVVVLVEQVLVDRGFDVRPPGKALVFRTARFAPLHGQDVATVPSCLCCVGRVPFATELGALFQERARGTVPFFGTVLAVGSEHGLAHARAALRADPFLLGRYRLTTHSRAVAEQGSWTSSASENGGIRAVRRP